MYLSTHLEWAKGVVAAASGEARGCARLGPPGGRGGQGARSAKTFFTREIEKSGQRGLTSGETKAC
jgi:hypothetical protein